MATPTSPGYAALISSHHQLSGIARVVNDTDAQTLQGFVADHASPYAKVYTDDHGAYKAMPFEHETVKHSVAEYVRN